MHLIEWNIVVEGVNQDAVEISRKGIKLSVSDKEGNHLGDLEINKSFVTWHKDKNTLKPGEAFDEKEFFWDKFIRLMEGHGVGE